MPEGAMGRGLHTFVLVWILSCATKTVTAQQGAISFRDATQSSGLRLVHDDGDAQDEGRLPSMMGSGVATLDFDNDGLMDVVGLTCGESGHSLFHQQAFGSFLDVSASSHLDHHSVGLGVAVADYDNDGFADVAISNLGSVTLLHNLGDGTYVDATQAAGLGNSGIAFGAGIAFLDIENDGDVDLFVADYVAYSHERFVELRERSYPYPPGPEQFRHQSDRLFVNMGNGRFEDGSQTAGLTDYNSPSMGMVCGDFDNDNDTDIFVCSDARPNRYYLNDGKGVFSQDAELQALAFNSQGIAIGAMGAEAADLDGDQAEDIFVTKYSTQMPLYYKNLVELGFEDIASGANVGRQLFPHVSWGIGAGDFDNDGDRDLVVGNGHLFKWANEVEQLTAFKVADSLLLNNGRGVFRHSLVQEFVQGGVVPVESSRGIAVDDLDRDGDCDILILNSDAPATYLENASSNGNHWVQIQLIGTRFNREGIGAKVTLESDGLVQTAEVRSGRGYQSHYGTILHFGLGNRSNVQKLVVNWLGETSEYRDLEVDQLHQILQSSSP